MRTISSIALGVPLFFAFSAHAEPADDDDKETPVAIEDLPREVTSAIEKKWPGAELLEAEKDGAQFDVELETADGRRLEAEVNADGTFGEIEDETAEESDDD